MDTCECVHTGGTVDTLSGDVAKGTAKKRQRRRTIKERRDVVEKTLVPGASVAQVARQHEVNANQVFYWRKLYREGQLGISTATPLLPVRVKREQAAKVFQDDGRMPSAGTMEINLSRGTLRVTGAVDVAALRAVLECLAR